MQTNSITTAFFLSKYQRVEYIGRNGNNYIDTLRVPKITTNFEVRIGFKFGNSGVRYAIIGNHYQGKNGQLSFEVNSGGVSNNSARYWGKGGSNVEDFYSSNSLTLNAFNDLIFKSNGSSTQTVVVNGTTTTGNLGLSTFYNASANLFIDKELRRTTFTANSFVSYLKIYENGTLIKDFVPAYRKSDNVIGMVDKVSKTFYTNKGSGTFSKGGNISR